MLKLKARGPWYHVEGTNSMGVKIPRHTIKIGVYDQKGRIDKSTKKAADALVLELERATKWPPQEEAPKEPEGQKLIDAFRLWLGTYPENSPTRQAYSSVEHALVAPLAAKGVVFVKDVTSEHLRALQESWTWKAPGEKRKQSTVKKWRRFSAVLFNHCVKYHDLAKNPWKTVDSIKEKKLTREEIMAGEKQDKGIATLPIDEKGHANWKRIQAAIPAFVKGELPGQSVRRANPLMRHPKTFFTMLWLMYETGLRRSDTLIFRPDKIVPTRHGGSYTTPQVKTTNEVVCFLPQELVEQLRALPLLPWRGSPELYTKFTKRPFTPGAGIYPFYDGSNPDHNIALKTMLDEPLRELGRLLFGEHAPSLRPHRFRDSFAVNMLNLGLSLDDVRRMLGHKSIKTTQDHYAPYVLNMQEAVMNRQAAAKQAAFFAEALEAPKPDASVN